MTEARTWRDFMPSHLPPSALITRAELLADLADIGVTERTVRYWESVGAIPRPVRQLHRGVVRALYPQWFGSMVRAVRERQQRGESLEAIAHTMPEGVAFFAVFAWGAEIQAPTLDIYEPELLPALQHFAARVSLREGQPVQYGVIMMYDAHGAPIKTIPWLAAGASLSDGEGG